MVTDKEIFHAMNMFKQAKSLFEPNKLRREKISSGNTVIMAKNEFSIIKSNDAYDAQAPGTGIVKTVELTRNNMNYYIHNDLFVLHATDGHCVFCNETIGKDKTMYFCNDGEPAVTNEIVEEIRNKLIFEWTLDESIYTYGKNYEVIDTFSIMDTYHFILKFHHNNKLAEIILDIDDNMKVNFKKVRGNVPDIVIDYIKENIVPEMIEEHKLSVLVSCSPITIDSLEEVLRNKSSKRGNQGILSLFPSFNNVEKQGLSEEQMIREILWIYRNNKIEDKEMIIDTLKGYIV